MSWSAATGIVDSYKLEQQKDGGAWTQIYSGLNLTFALSALTDGVYGYRVKACNTGGCSAYTASTGTIVAIFPGAPASLSGVPPTDNDGAYTATWESSAGAVTSYQLYSQLNGGAWTLLFNAAGNSKAISGLTDGTYKYRVRACNKVSTFNSCGYWTNSADSIVAVQPGAPGQVTASLNNVVGNNVTIGWQSAAGTVDTYQVEQAIDGSSSWSNVYSGLGNTATLIGVSNGSYQFRVRACNTESTFNSCSESTSTTAVTIQHLGDPVSVTVPSASSTGSAVLSWQPGIGTADYFTLEQKVDSDAWTVIGNVTGTQTLLSGLNDGSYTYRIKACNTFGCTGYRTSSSLVVAKVGKPASISGPSTVEMISAVTDFTLTWPVSTGTVTRYELQERPASGTWTVAYSGVAPQFQFLNHGYGNYQYRVRACNSVVCSAYSAIKSVSLIFTAAPAAAPAPNNVLATLSSLVPAAAVAASDAIGTTAGNFRVDESGSATYSIPLALPQGSAGVTPQLSLNYSSSGGNGQLGVGWSLQGLSGVSRCRQTLGQDKSPKAITWSSSDRFCLDGSRLLVQGGSTYGAVGASYKTEIDNFAVVESHGGSVGHPDYFIVKRKDGSVTYYGNTTDAKQITSDGLYTLSWAQNRFEDSVGNGINYTYTNTATGHRLLNVKYGGANDNLSEVRLTWSDRDDDIRGYVASYLFSTEKLLSNITVYNNGTEIKSYELTYLANTTLNKSKRLASVQECADSVCLPATTFDWSLPEYTFSTTGQSISLGGSHSRALGAGNFKPADINGDGLMDIVWFYHLQDGGSDIDYVLQYALSNGQKLVPATFSDGATGKRWNDDGGLKFDVIDYNADGRQDVVFKNGTSGNWRVYLSQPQSNGTWKLSASQIDTGVATRNITWADFNSDGLVDTVQSGSNGNDARITYLKRSTAIADSSPSAFALTNNKIESFVLPPGFWGVPASAGSFEPVGDINGDGLSDISTYVNGLECNTNNLPYSMPCWGAKVIYSLDGSGELYYQLPTGTNFSNVQQSVYGDINSDGLSDTAYGFYASGTTFNWYYVLGTGAAKGVQKSIGNYSNEAYPKLIDYNNDGYQDFVFHESSKMKVRLWDTESQSFTWTPIDAVSTDGDVKDGRFFMDVNADGVNDYVLFKDDKLYTYLAEGVDASSNKIVKITTGLGAETDITYEPLGKSGHYERLTVGSAAASHFCFPTDCPTYNFTPANSGAFYSAINGDWTGSDTLGKTGPVLELNGPIPVVTNVASSAPTAANPAAKSSISYYYAEAKIQASGRGMLGFERLKTVDDQTGVQTVTTYRQDWPFIGYPLDTKVYTAAGNLLKESKNTWRLQGYASTWRNTINTLGSAALGHLQPYISQSTEIGYNLVNNGATQGAKLATSITDNIYDNYGNPTQITITTKDGADSVVSTKATVNSYGSTEWEKQMGRLSRTDVTTTRAGQVQNRSSAFTYYDSGALTGLLKQEIIEPDNAQYRLATTYEYDGFGNKVKATQSGASGGQRSSTTVYDAEGRYVVAQKNAYGQTVQQVLNYNNLGQPVAVLDINGARAENRYSPMGRKYLSASVAGSYSSTLLQTCDSHCPATAVYLAYTAQADGAVSKTYYDNLGREARSAARQFDGTWVFVDTEYDNLGRVKRKSEPHTGTPQYWTTLSYDILGRVVSTTLPGTATPVAVAYNGLTVVTTNPLGQTKTEVKNVMGELVNVYDHLGGRVHYQYDVQGNLLTATSSGGGASVPVNMSYDLLGRKVAMNDPDKGSWAYSYNTFGELIEQTDAKGQKTVMTYDALGRMINRLDKRADSSIEADTEWTYNNATSGVGLGALLNVEDHTSGYIKIMGYDSLGRLNETVTSFAANDDHYEKVTYDQLGRTYQVFDAGGDGSWQSSAIQNHYNAYGYLEKVTDATYVNGVSKTTYYKVDAMDLRGNVTEATHGNGVIDSRHYDPATGRLLTISGRLFGGTNTLQYHTYSWDAIGNLLERYDTSANKNIRETFLYDGLNRVTQAQVVGQTAQTVSYDSLGNITYKSDVGNYSYGSECSTGFGPHAVCETSDGIDYTYDANGNLTADTAAGGFGGRTLNYTTFDMPSQITKGGHTTTFKYGPDRARYMRTDTNNSNTTVTRYIGSVEKLTKDDGSQEIKRYIGSALVTVSKDSAGNKTGEATQYLLKDHLGSIAVITNAVGQVVQEMSFDAWGQRRNAIDWDNYDFSQISTFNTDITTRGFTGHEMLDEVGLVHMNGRIYDARLGRFVQADPHVDGVTDTQGYNRYSYVHNNPLNATDPTGFSSWTSFRDNVLKPVIQVVVTVICIPCGAALAAATTLYNGGNLFDAAIAAFSTYAMATVGGNIGAPGGAEFGFNLPTLGFATLGGITSELQGGKFGHGFVSAGVGSIAGAKLGPMFAKGRPVGEVIGGAVIGGTLSKMTGGKFANGAAYGAFSAALQELSSGKRGDEKYEDSVISGDFEAVSAEDAQAMYNSDHTVVSDVGEKLTNVHFKNEYAYYDKDGNLQTSTSAFLAKKGASEGQGWVGGRTNLTTGEITIYRTAYALDIKGIVTGYSFSGRPLITSVNYIKGYSSGLFVIGHELGHAMRSISSETRANFYAEDIMHRLRQNGTL